MGNLQCGVFGLQVSMLAKEDQLLEARKRLAEKAQQLQELQEQQNSTNLKFVEQMRAKEEGWKERFISYYPLCTLV
jgi:hypothetical protein